MNAQNGNPNWCIPSNYLYNNQQTYPLPAATPGYSVQPTFMPSNMYCDASGKILFFGADAELYNRQGHLISRLTYTINAGGSTQTTNCEGWSKMCIVPHPDSCTKYYIFTEFDYTASDDYVNDCGYSGGYGNGGLHRAVYAQIDMAQMTPNYTGEYGKNIYASTPTATITTKDLYLSTSTVASQTINAGCSPYPGDFTYACTRLLAGSYRLLFVNNGLEVIVYKIDVNGITFLYNYDHITISNGYGGGGVNELGKNMTEMEVFEDSVNNRIKVALVAAQNYANNKSGVNLQFLDFNFTTGQYISNTNQNISLSGQFNNVNNSDSVVYVRGLEFSPNGNWVYVLHRPSGTHPAVLHVFSYASPSTSYSVTPSGVNMSDFRYSQMEIGTDTALYLIGQNGASAPRMAKITSPSAPWNASSNFTDNLFTLSGYGNQTVDYAGYMFYLPDQIDHQDYDAVLNANASCCIQYNDYDKMTYTASTAYNGSTVQVWSPNTSTVSANNPIASSTNLTSTVTIGEELRIPAGYTVTIRNMTIKFSPQATLVVEATNGTLNSGQLTLKKCTLDVDTRCAQKMWPGVRVWGNTAYTRNSTSQGYLIVDSLTVITNARLGVELGYETFDAAYDASVVPAPTNTATAGGGQLLCTNSSFINNERDIYFGAYPNSGGLSSINTSTFVTSATLIESGVSPRYFIGLKDYQPNALINGCHLSCSSNLTYALLDTGIYSLNSNYTVNKHINTGKRTSIHNLNYGVHSSNTSGTRSVTIKNSNLINNIIGIYLGKINNAYVTETDTFKLHNKMWTRGNSIGLYLDNCTGYWVQDNHFDRNALGSKNLYGILVYNSGPYANAIFRNTFANLYKGSQAQYINYVASDQIANGVGLLYLCNKFTSISGGDIYVPARTEGANIGTTYTCSPCYQSGIGYAQGAGNSAINGNRETADNEFSHTGKDFWLGTVTGDNALNSSYVYFCPNTTLSTCSDGTFTSVWKPDPALSNNYLPSPYYLSSPPDCSTGGNGHRELEPLEQALADAEFFKARHDSLQELYAASPNDFSLNLQMASAFSDWHLALDRAIRLLLENHADSSNTVAYELMKQKADALPARVRVETGINTGDSAYAAQALAEVIAQEGQSNYVKIQSLLLKNISKLPHEYMTSPTVLSEVSAIASDSSDIPSYVTANMLLHAVGAGHYEPYVQETDTDNGAAERSNTAISTLDNKLSSRPNPFNESTTITATVVERSDNAFILITDVLGKEVARYPVHQGENAVSFDGSQTGQQVLFCTLVVNDVKIKTNKLVLIK